MTILLADPVFSTRAFGSAALMNVPTPRSLFRNQLLWYWVRCCTSDVFHPEADIDAAVAEDDALYPIESDSRCCGCDGGAIVLVEVVEEGSNNGYVFEDAVCIFARVMMLLRGKMRRYGCGASERVV